MPAPCNSSPDLRPCGDCGRWLEDDRFEDLDDRSTAVTVHLCPTCFVCEEPVGVSNSKGRCGEPPVELCTGCSTPRCAVHLRVVESYDPETGYHEYEALCYGCRNNDLLEEAAAMTRYYSGEPPVGW